MISIFVKVLPSLNKQHSPTKRDQCTLECESQKDLATLASIQSLVYIHLWALCFTAMTTLNQQFSDQSDN